MPLPLSGLRVVDFSRVLAGPHCGKHLIDLGAEVIKVEPPGGDLSRRAFPMQGAVAGYYAQQNAGKRDISVDLNVPEMREVVMRLCETADVIVENFRPGALGSFGLDYESVAAVKPDIVYVSVSGYGQRGNWAGRMAYAPTVQAEVGFTRTTLTHFQAEGGARRTDALSHADVYSGLHATIAVLAALQHRAATGQGQYVDVAMAAVMTSINERVHVDLGEVELGAERPVLGATDAPFFTSPEGDPFVVPMSLVGSLTFPFYCRAMRRPDLADDPRFLAAELREANFAALHAIVQTWIGTFDTMGALDAQFDEAKIATGIVRGIDEFAASEWADEWGVTRTVSDRAAGTITIPGMPWHFSRHEEPLGEQVPALQGEHNVEVLTELGYDQQQIESFYTAAGLVEPDRARS
ncbi:CoA transferase [Actinomycetospora corticicola]|uniref:Crotonobetainyl-CoA:carnitine CoA-transferase CaiB-like acyl-CoA transferase n=1 Tax=Actinomycetospora corticicola TaxID=663602 RepID=A0A7Y9E292_9PSEU|nr:CaiB/BaiF CoA-transferase family protein [Actinomycetospora corticicola]NYD39809.1 crotonobetainyl-CoA:carnitine CoA-transferase CaiB-like acyl-CoA transferase [Actinomycetospora corticicola]